MSLTSPTAASIYVPVEAFEEHYFAVTAGQKVSAVRVSTSGTFACH